MAGPHRARRNITTDDENGWRREGEHLDVRVSLTDQLTVAAPASPAVVLTPAHTACGAHKVPSASPGSSSGAALAQCEPPWLGCVQSACVLEQSA